MIELVRYLGYLLILIIIIVVIVKQSSRPRCDQCRARLGKKGVKRNVYGEEKLICLDCNDRMRANEGVADLDNMSF
jgi:hypothetical protein